ncbi:lipopolysaccharide kinase InaA family protein [Chishuiella sp.]|uniref:lipopolysaccharide kinase InaA family protein n=1 Tax=Chishuiella sp. TaxID=1969467 RepID=UPI0028ABC14C|nr:lipopolysaccharide kinase InaA family protein [Chishuiella sp.]
MMSKIVLNNNFPTTKKEIESIIKGYDSINQYIAKGTRNSIKKTQLESGKIVTIKSFKIPNIINKFIYKFFRQSKAERSFEYANKLVNLGFLTPLPVAYIEETTTIQFLKSYYLCELVEADLTYRELVEIADYPNKIEILKQFTQFTYQLHEAGIEFLDHSPGNTLIKKVGENSYDFYLVDLNRMNFHTKMDFELRMKNFSRLTPYNDMVEIMAKEYAKLINEEETKVINEMWKKTEEFQTKFHKKQERKKKLKKLIEK